MTGTIQNRLCIFARTPELGQVKQRLAASLGEAGALAAHEELLRSTLDRTVGAGDYQVEVWLTSLAVPLPDWLCGYAFSLHEQRAGDLGQRMLSTLAAALESGDRCVLIGSDCPQIDGAYLASAFDALAEFDVVLGPAEDGGYGLVGMSQPAPAIFAESSWGDDGVLQRALERAEKAGISVSLCPEIYDVDEPVDWQRFKCNEGADTR
jgi:rSAM/selenodomain-associated transferase 1